ncbi:MAG: hypothetical protein IPM57_10975 [Oligoflexia bacterium]|nr:hypothetical protein [Oligoflexia bacterium]
MMKGTFMKVVLSALLTVQLVLPTTVFAQSQGMLPSSSFYAGDNAVTAPAAGTTTGRFGDVGSDPWSIGGDQGTGWSGGWTSDPSLGTDPYSLGWGSGMGYTTLNPMDDLGAYILQASGVLNYPYYQDIRELKKSRSYTNDDEIAEQIIKKASISAGSWGALASILFALAPLNPKLNPSSGSASGWGIGIGIGLVLGGEFLAVFKTQSEMILKLAALYGELPDTPQARASLLNTTLAIATGIGTGTTLFQSKLTKYLEKRFGLLVVNSAKGVINQIPTTAFQQVVSEGAQAATAKVIANQIPAAVQQSFIKEVTFEATERAAMQGLIDRAASEGAQVTVTKTAARGVLAKIRFSDDTKKLGAGLLAGFISAGIAYGINALPTMWIGNNAKAKFKADRAARTAEAVVQVKSSPIIRKTLWMILTRDVFKRIPNKELQLSYAQAVATEIPLIKNNQVDEYKEIAEEFNQNTKQICANTKAKVAIRRDLDEKAVGDKTVILTDDFDTPKMDEDCDPKSIKTVSVAIDKNLVTIKRLDVNTEAKIYFLKLILAGMYQKGTLDADDYKSLDAVAIMLGLMPPPNVQVARNDKRLVDIGRYLSLLAEMDKAAYTKEIILAKAESIKNSGDENKKNALNKVQTWGPGGSIILEDLESAAPLMRVIEESILQKGGVTGEQAKVIQETAKKQVEKALEDESPKK